MDVIETRDLREADAQASAALIRAAFAEQGLVTEPPSSALCETAETIAGKLAAGGGAGVEIGGTLIGVVLWTAEDDALQLGRLAVAPTWRGRGLASRLLEAGEAEARRRAFARLRLNARIELPLNRKLFARHGFVEVGARAHPGYQRPTIVVMEKPIV